jgi:arsenate reductase-like glutaredoxin family protein
MLNHEHLIGDINGIVQAFVNGSIYTQEEINTECANAISFLITHQIVYSKNDWVEDQASNYILDSLMHLTASTSKFIRTRAFSTLSTLSTYCASSELVMLQI